MGTRGWFVVGALMAGLAVAVSAYGAHGIKPKVDKGQIDAQRLEDFEIAARNHMIHAIALVLAGLVGRVGNSTWSIHVAGAAFLLGILLFCGGLYGYALSDNRDYLSAAPAGGISFMVGWAALAVAGWKSFAARQVSS
ncbi:MAG TPA: DUF423 domain-containing protein [Pirellulales bacterium]|nr:DUF423 domain-containing protein [Pirellulales bacterium]